MYSSAVQCSTIKYTACQCSTVHCSAVQYAAVQCSIVRDNGEVETESETLPVNQCSEEFIVVKYSRNKGSIVQCSTDLCSKEQRFTVLGREDTVQL